MDLRQIVRAAIISNEDSGAATPVGLSLPEDFVVFPTGAVEPMPITSDLVRSCTDFTVCTFS